MQLKVPFNIKHMNQSLIHIQYCQAEFKGSYIFCRIERLPIYAYTRSVHTSMSTHYFCAGHRPIRAGGLPMHRWPTGAPVQLKVAVSNTIDKLLGFYCLSQAQLKKLHIYLFIVEAATVKQIKIINPLDTELQFHAPQTISWPYIYIYILVPSIVNICLGQKNNQLASSSPAVRFAP